MFAKADKISRSKEAKLTFGGRMSTAISPSPMQFHWTTHYSHSDATLVAEPGKVLLVVDYRAMQLETRVGSRPRLVPQEDAISIAQVFAETLVEPRPFKILRVEPELVLQVQSATAGKEPLYPPSPTSI